MKLMAPTAGLLAAGLLCHALAAAAVGAAASSFRPLRLQGVGPPRAAAAAAAAPAVKTPCALGGEFYRGLDVPLAACLSACEADATCGGFSFKQLGGVGENSTAGGGPLPAGEGRGNCTLTASGRGAVCCYMQHPEAITASDPREDFSCWQKPPRPGNASFALGSTSSPFPHFWETGINSPHSAMTLRSDYQAQMTALHEDIGYQYTRIHAPFARDYSLAQGPNGTVSYYNAFVTYDFLLSIGMKPWIELGYTPCWMSGPAAVPADSYWPTVDYGLCVGSPEKMTDWTDLIDHYVGTMVDRYGLEEVESWVWCEQIQNRALFNEPGGVNAYAKEWESAGFTYYEMFFNTSKAIKKHSKKITFGGLSDSPSQAEILMNLTKELPEEREGAFDIFAYHEYCNGKTPAECGASQISVVNGLRGVLPAGMPIYLEETGSSAGCYVPFHDTTGEAAFVVPYVAAMHAANLSGAHWWCASDLYTEHGCPPAGKGFEWIPHENYSGGMPRSEFTGRWGFTTPSGIPKPIHRAFSLLHAAGTERMEATAKLGGTCGDSTTVLALANETVDHVVAAEGGVMIFLSNTGKENCSVTLTGLPQSAKTALLHTIDSTHGNPYGLWQSWGSPPFPTLKQTAQLREMSAFHPEAVTVEASGEMGFKLEPDALQVLVI